MKRELYVKRWKMPLLVCCGKQVDREKRMEHLRTSLHSVYVRLEVSESPQ